MAPVMAKILLLSCNTSTKPSPVYPLGLSVVAQAARNRGHEVLEWDLLLSRHTLEETAQQAAELGPDCIGLSLKTLSHLPYTDETSYISHYRRVVKSLKKAHPGPIILGGPAFSLFPEFLLEYLQGDYGIIGEGECAFYTLVEQIANGSPPQAKIISGTKKPGAYAIPVRDDAMCTYYKQSGGMLNIETKRGCPYRCIYCPTPELEGRSYRHRACENVANEIHQLVRQQGMDYYFIVDSVFNDPAEKYLALAEEILRKDITIPWTAYLRPRGLKKRDLDLLKRAGLYSVEIGVDASTDTTLEQMGKGFSWDDVMETCSLLNRAGIHSAFFIIFGGPGETARTLKEGLHNVEQLTDCVVFGDTGIRVLPKTPLYEKALQEGLIPPDRNLLDPFVYTSPEVSEEWLRQEVTTAFKGRTDRVYPHATHNSKVPLLRKMGYRGPAWELLKDNRADIMKQFSQKKSGNAWRKKKGVK